MKLNRLAVALVVGGGLTLGAVTLTVAQEDEPRIAFPADFASEFTLYMEIDRVQNPGQVMRIYANDVALSGLDSEGRFPAGSILVGQIFAARTDADGNVIISDLGRQIIGNPAAVAVMEKEEGWGDAFPDELRNDDWDFAIFSPAGERLDRDLNACRSCHAPLGDIDHVFSFQHVPLP
ncbi:MAG: cytochrome P460 family protein [Bauldia sp.]|nr:cytochrome P460 family protein [Bauldia sp.]